MNRRLLLTGCAFAAMAVAYRGQAAEIATDTPEATIATLQRGLIAAASTPANAAIEQRYRDARARRSWRRTTCRTSPSSRLRRQWSSLAEADRATLRRGVRALERHDVCGAIQSVRPSTFTASSAKPADASGRVQVTTAIKREGQADVALEYLLQKDERQLAHHQHRRRRRQ